MRRGSGGRPPPHTWIFRFLREGALTTAIEKETKRKKEIYRIFCSYDAQGISPPPPVVFVAMYPL